jgi:hypothetical protein
LLGKPERKRSLGRSRCRWVVERWDEVMWDWTNLTQDRDKLRAIVNMAMNLQVSLNVE